MVTLQELSTVLGVSTATISNALKGKGRMRPELRTHILETAKKMGYDIRSAQLRQHSKTIYILAEQIGAAYQPTLIERFCMRAEETGVQIFVCNLNVVERLGSIIPPIERLKEVVRPVFHNVVGLANGIVYLSQYPRDLSGLLPKTTIPLVVAHGYTSEATTCVNYDDAQGAYVATEHLVRCGRKQIAMISGPIDSIPMTKRLSGYQRALLDGGLAFDPQLIQLSDWFPNSGYTSAKMLLQMEKRPDAFFCQNDSMAIGAMRAVKEMGLRVPEDVAIVGFDNDRFGVYVEPTLTTIKPPFEEIGEKLFDCLWGLMNGQKQQESIKLKCTLLERESTKRVHSF